MFRNLTLTAAALLMAIAACGDSGSSSSDTEISVSAKEFDFTPTSWSVAANTEVTINFTNDGSIDHEWAVLTEGTNISNEDEFNEDIVEWEIEATPAGTSVTETHSFAPGTYQVVCALDGHFNAGMEGTLVVSGG
jgi:plastocyanin